MIMTQNIAKAVVIAVLTKRFWKGKNLSPRMAVSDENRKDCFELMIASIPDAISDIVLERDVNLDRRLAIGNTIGLWTDPKNAEDAMLSIVDALHSRFGYDV